MTLEKYRAILIKKQMIIYLGKVTEIAIAENRHPAKSQHRPSQCHSSEKKRGERDYRVLSNARVVDAKEVLKEKEKDLKKRVEEAEWVRKREEKNAKLAKETKKKGWN
jgi:hypothetical protein